MSLIPSRFLDTVVAIGLRQPDSSIEYTATGFVYRVAVDQDAEGHQLYATFIVTNRHVIEGSHELVTRQNHHSGVRVVGDTPRREWTVHPDPDIDVAVYPFHIANSGETATGPLSFYDTDTMLRSRMIETEFREGNEIFVLGFPLAMVGGYKNYVIVRHGIVARMQDWYEDAAKSFLIDSSIFPGNSGGPVLAKPTLHTYGNAITSAKLIGMVSAYVPYQDIARSDQTGLPILASAENSGLAIVVPVDAIKETITTVVDQYKLEQGIVVPEGEG